MRPPYHASIVFALSSATALFAGACACTEDRAAQSASELAAEEIRPAPEVFLVLASDDKPAELRLKDPVSLRFELTTREEIAKRIAGQAISEMTLRYGETVPRVEITDLTEFLTRQGVRTIWFKIAPPPPHNPRPATRE